MATPLFSKLCKVQIDSSTIGYATDFSLSLNKDMIEIAILSSSGAKASIPDMYGWTVSGSGLVVRNIGMTAGDYGMFNIATNMLAATDASVLVAIVPDVSTNKYFEGTGYFSSLSMEGGVGAAGIAPATAGGGVVPAESTDVQNQAPKAASVRYASVEERQEYLEMGEEDWMKKHGIWEGLSSDEQDLDSGLNFVVESSIEALPDDFDLEKERIRVTEMKSMDSPEHMKWGRKMVLPKGTKVKEAEEEVVEVVDDGEVEESFNNLEVEVPEDSEE